MVYSFKFLDSYIIFDVESGSLHLGDKLSHLLIEQRNGKKVDLSEFSVDEINECKSELSELEKEQVLFTPEVEIEYSNKTDDIKALCLHISHNCNLACEYCFAGGGNYNGTSGNMSFEVAKNAIDFLIESSGDIKNLEVDFFGGEPLLNLDVVKKTVEYAKARTKECGKQIHFTLTTNAMLLDEETSNYLNEEMDNIVLSIDGRKSVHSSVRKTKNGGDCFDIILEKCKQFKSIRKDKNYYVRGTFTARNLDFAKDVLYLADEGFDQISLEPVVLESGELQIKDEHIERIKSEYETLALEYIKRRKDSKTWFNFFHFMVDLKGGPCLKKRLNGCGAGNNYLAITPSGEIYPCHRFAENSKYKMGELSNSAKYTKENLNRQIRDTFANSNLLTKEECKKCFAKYICSGGCNANNIIFENSADKPYKLACELMKKRLECSLYIFMKENIQK